MNIENESTNIFFEKIPLLQQRLLEMIIHRILNLRFPQLEKSTEKFIISGLGKSSQQEPYGEIDRTIMATAESLGEKLRTYRSLNELRNYCLEHNLPFPDEKMIQGDKTFLLDEYLRESKSEEIH